MRTYSGITVCTRACTLMKSTWKTATRLVESATNLLVYVSSYYCICILILLYLYPHTTIYVSSLRVHLDEEQLKVGMRQHTSAYMSIHEQSISESRQSVTCSTKKKMNCKRKNALRLPENRKAIQLLNSRRCFENSGSRTFSPFRSHHVPWSRTFPIYLSLARALALAPLLLSLPLSLLLSLPLARARSLSLSLFLSFSLNWPPGLRAPCCRASLLSPEQSQNSFDPVKPNCYAK